MYWNKSLGFWKVEISPASEVGIEDPIKCVIHWLFPNDFSFLKMLFQKKPLIVDFN